MPIIFEQTEILDEFLMSGSTKSMPYLQIEIINKHPTWSDQKIFELLLKNYSSRYSIHNTLLNIEAKTVLNISFLNSTQLEQRMSDSMAIYDFFLKNYFQDKEPDKFQYWQRILKEREKNEDETHDSFLTLKYQTNIIPIFRPYYQFINKFVTIFESLYFIEEIADGFLLFFEREEDFQDYLFNLLSPQDLEAWTRLKKLKFPNGIYDQLEKMILEKMQNSHI